MDLTKAKYIKDLLNQACLELGFSPIRVIDVQPLLQEEKRFLEWRHKGYAGSMSYLKRANPINARPEMLMANAKSLIIFTANYYTHPPQKPGSNYGRIANYATGLDYHKVLKKKIKNIFKQNTELAKLLESSRFFTDAVPLLEKSFAQKAGLGFQGKNTLLISKQQGSYNFILEFISDLELEADTDLTEHMATCGACHRCNTVCPTDALKSEYEIDARECISYLTIENRDEVPLELRNKIGDWIFGCDLCQSICPYNRKNLNNIENIKAMETKIHEFHPTQGLGHWLNLNSVLCLDQNTTKYIDDYYDPKITNILKKIFGHDVNEYLDQIFYNHFGSTSLSRTKREGLIRNAIIVATNNKSEESLPLIKRLCNSSNKVISDLAKWSLAK